MTSIPQFTAALAASAIPDHMHDGVSRYVLNGVPPGGFLTALLSNDLKETFSRADDANQRAVLDYIKLLYNYAPTGVWGSPAKVSDWITLGGWHGLEAQYVREAAEQGTMG